MRRFFLFLTIIISLSAFAQDPAATDYSFEQCQGSAMPYPAPQSATDIPDGLRPIMINHVGRHGARFPATAKHTLELRKILLRADSLSTITPLGRELLNLTSFVLDRCHNYWGALDSLGMAEQRGIASRMFVNFPSLFTDRKINAISSYSPRCVMSMYEFTHQLDRLNNKLEINTSSGRQNSRLMRPFDDDLSYKEFVASKVWETPYADVASQRTPLTALRRVIGDIDMPRSEAEAYAMAQYSFLAGMSAMSVDIDLSRYFTREEINALWSLFNLRQYLLRAATTLSAAPAEIASPLLLDIITTTDSFLAGDSDTPVRLRFGHAETLMPLFSMLHIDGAYYLTNYFDTVGQHWRDFSFVPMAANLQMIVFENEQGDRLVRFDLNERPIRLIPNDERIYLPWADARAYLVRCLPLIDQP